jgi:hypothetical protein
MATKAHAYRTELADQRADERISTALAGKLFVPAEDIDLDCQVTNLSAGGAGVQCAEPPPLDTFIVLYVEWFGRFECVTTRFVENELGLKFVCEEAKRQRLLQDLAAYASGRTVNATRLRQYPRSSSNFRGHFRRQNGELESCSVINVSLQGVSLRSKVRPPVGETVEFGLIQGRVVRHHGDGFSLQFLDAACRDLSHGD